MMKKNDESSAALLRRVLRAGDPAGDGIRPSAEQVAALHRTLLSAPEPRRWVPLWAPAALAASLIVLFAASLAIRIPPPAPSETSPIAESGPSLQGAGGAHPVEMRGPNGTRILWFSGPSASVELPGTQDPTRMLHFKAPGGTRIFWFLNDEFNG